jgi:hypothetical protein
MECCGCTEDETILAVLDSYPEAVSIYNEKDQRKPLHIGMAYGAPAGAIQAVLEMDQQASERTDSHCQLPLHLGIQFLGEQLALREETENTLTSILYVLQAFPGAAARRDKDGWTPLFALCKILQIVHENPEETAVVMQKIFDAYPEAAEIMCSSGACPINILVEECSRARSVESALKNNSVRKLSVLLKVVRDGRSLRTLCTLSGAHHDVPIVAFLFLFDEGDLRQAKSRDGIPRLDLNSQIIAGWTLLEMLADFDTTDSPEILLHSGGHTVVFKSTLRSRVNPQQ